MKRFLLLLFLIPYLAFADAVIFSGNDVKALKQNLDLFGVVKIMSGSLDPAVTGVAAPVGSAYFSTVHGLHIKTGVTNTDWTKNSLLPVDLTTDVTGILPVANGGTGSATQNFVDLTTNQTVGGTKTFSSAVVSDDYEFSDANFNTISSKESLAVMGSTGVMDGGIVSIGTPNTTVTISDGSGYCSSNTGTNSLEKISWTGLTNQALTFLNTNLVTYLAIDCSTGLLSQQVTPYTNVQSRDFILIGAAIHSDLTTVNAVNQLQQVTISPLNQLGDLQRSLGFFNIYGNIYSANGANLNINKTIGDVHKQGANWSSNSKNPNVVTLSPGTALTFRYRTQTGAEGSDVTAVNPAQYDLAGVLTSVPVSRFTVQRINVFSSGLTRIQYGQALYNNEADAIAAIQVDPFITETNISENGLLRGFLIVKGNATDLSDPDQAMFLEAPKFGGTGGVGGLSTTTLQGAYNNSTTPQIITSTALGSVDIRRGSATDTDNVIRIQNGAGSSTATINGNGLLTLSTALPISSGGTGSATQNFVDLTNNQTIAGVKTFSSTIVGSVNGNAATVTTNANLTGDVTSVGNATTYNSVVPINKGGTGAITKAAAFDALSPMTTVGDLIYGGASGTGTRLAIGTATHVLTSNGAGLAPSWQPGTTSTPTIQKFTSGSGTYTTPANVKYIRVTMVGAGGGGAGSGTASGGAGGNGSPTTFGTTLLSANGGGGAVFGASYGGAGGTASLGTGPVGLALSGGEGGGVIFGSTVTARFEGGRGGSSYFGGAGGSTYDSMGRAGATNTGAGGAGGGTNGTASSFTGPGGGSGGFVEAIIGAPSATYAYSVGAAGAGGTAGTNGFAGGAGGSGVIVVEEYY